MNPYPNSIKDTQQCLYRHIIFNSRFPLVAAELKHVVSLLAFLLILSSLCISILPPTLLPPFFFLRFLLLSQAENLNLDFCFFCCFCLFRLFWLFFFVF